MNNLELSEETSVVPTEVFLDGTSITEFDLESTCRDIIIRLNSTDDTNEIEQAITNLNGVEVFAAKAKSKLVFAYSQWYQAHNPNGSFADWYIQKFGGKKSTVQKHQAIGELLMDNEVPEEVKLLPSKELVSVSRARQSGYNLDEHWEELQMAGSEEEVNAVIHKIKGTEPRQGSLSISVHPDGSITGWMNNVMVMGGWLNFADRDNVDFPGEKKEVLKLMLSRIINNSRMKIK